MPKDIQVEISARHVHLSKEHLMILFGDDAVLTVKKDLSQPGQFACNEKVRVIGPKGEFPSVSILGPVRAQTQVEVSFTDARALGVVPPVRNSGDLEGSVGCVIEGPKGRVELTEGVIVVKRHIHMTPEDAQLFGVSDKEIVRFKVDSPDRSLIFGDVIVRVSDKFATRAHFDTDEGNAAGVFGTVFGQIIKEDK